MYANVLVQYGVKSLDHTFTYHIPNNLEEIVEVGRKVSVPFGSQKISKIKTSDAKLFLIKMQQEDGRGHSTIKTVRGVLRPAFQMAVDDDLIRKNPFNFQL